jgi:hypothetical protein
LALGIAGAGAYSLDALLNFSLAWWLFLVLLVIAVAVDVVGYTLSIRKAPSEGVA